VSYLVAQNKNKISSQYVGIWESSFTNINVRSKTGFFKWKFISGSVKIILQINDDNFASGKIGNSEFKSASIKKNRGIGISYIIDCGEVGKLFENDPEEKKSLQLWLIPINENDTLRAELRLSSSDKYPMGEFKLFRKN